MVDPLVSLWTKDWRRKRHQKHRRRGGVEARLILAQAFYWGEHMSTHSQDAVLSRAFRKDADKNKLRIVFEMVQREVDRKIGRFWSIAHEYLATPNVSDPSAFDKAEVITQLVKATDFKLEQHMKRWLIYYWLLTGGVVAEHVDWKDQVTVDVMPARDEAGNLLWKDSLTGEETTEEMVQQAIRSGLNPDRFTPAEEVIPVGEIGGDIIDPLRLFIDAALPRISALGPDQSVEIAEIVTRGYLEQTFGTEVTQGIRWKNQDLTIVETKLQDTGTPVAGINLKDLLPHVQGSRDPNDPEMCIMLTRYQPSHQGFNHGRRSFYVPDGPILFDGEIPYPEIPLIDFHWRPPATTFWTKDFVTRLIAPQKFLNKRMSQLGEAANAQVYALRLLGPGLSKKNIPTDIPGDVQNGLTADGQARVQYVKPPELPSFFPESIRLVTEFIEQLGGADLLSQRKFPGELRGSLAIPMLQEIIDSEDGPVYSHMGECFAREKQMRINRIKQYYPASRTLTYCGEDQKQEVLVLHTDEILRAGVDFTISIEEGSLMPELASMRWARVKETISSPLMGIYTNKRTGRIDYSKVAHDLKYSDKGRLSRENQYRKLARQISAQIRAGKLVVQPPDPQAAQMAQLQGQPPPQPKVMDVQRGRPFIVFPFWDHNVMLDEYEAVMGTLEFQQDTSIETMRTFLFLYELSRRALQALQDAQAQAVNSAKTESAMAMVMQNAGAHAAALAIEGSLDQLIANANAAKGPPDLQTRLRSEIASTSAGSEGGLQRRAAMNPRGQRQLPEE